MAENNIAPKRMELAEGRVNPSLPSELARFVIEHPHAAKGMGDGPHSEWLKMQELALAALFSDKVSKEENNG